MEICLLEDNQPEFFPDPRLSDNHGLVAVSRGLGLTRLVAAYRNGIFPWMKMNKAPYFWCWYSPNPRMVLYPKEFKVSRSLKTALLDKRFEIRVNQAFLEVMRACANVPRPGQESSWIEDEMLVDYGKLHDQGVAHSIEAYQQKELVGGLYGLTVGKVFFGESMFHYQPEASKVCMAKLVEFSIHAGFQFIDCQVPNPFLKSIGAREIRRDEFLDQLKLGCDQITTSFKWPVKS